MIFTKHKSIIIFIPLFMAAIFSVSAALVKNAAAFSVSDILAAVLKSSEEVAVGYVDDSVENKVKICRDITCSDPLPGIINFNLASTDPLVIDGKKGLTGKIWGNELGWISFNPPYGGVFFADIKTGLLKGTAWSETSGAINFSVTGQQVVINPETGEWQGWAWASGPYGGWIKFDCAAGSCVRSTWRGATSASPEVKPPETLPGVGHPSESSPKPGLGETILSQMSDIWERIKESVLKHIDKVNRVALEKASLKNAPAAPETMVSEIKDEKLITMPESPALNTYIPEENYAPSSDSESYGAYISTIDQSSYFISDLSTAPDTENNNLFSIFESLFERIKNMIIDYYNFVSLKIKEFTSFLLK